MNQTSFNFEEFIKNDSPSEKADEKHEPKDVAGAEDSSESTAPELDVQKAVVEELAVEKIELKEKLAGAEADILALKTKYEKTLHELQVKTAEVFSLKSELEKASSQSNALSSQLSALITKEEDQQERNPNALALLDRDVELPDRFPGETRDHVIEVIREARNKAEEEGRIRRAQLLESVLGANEPNGTLAKRRKYLENLFAENGNILTGTVMEELKKLGISHRNGEEYLLPSEIINRTY